MPLRVVLIDDDARFRSMARIALGIDGVEVVAEVEDGNEAVAAVARWCPDVVLLDVGLAGIDGLEVARRLRAAAPRPVVILISSRDADYGRCLANGLAEGYLPKDALSLEAILSVTTSAP